MTQHQNEDTRNAMQAGSAIAASVLQQAETWSRTQCELVSGIESICNRWMQWQREAIDAAGRSLAAISECRDLGNILQIQHEWLTDAARRSASNWSALAKEATELPWRVVRVEQKRDQPRSGPPRTEQREQTSLHRQAAE